MDDSPSAWGLKKNTPADMEAMLCIISIIPGCLKTTEVLQSCFLTKNSFISGDFFLAGAIRATHLKQLLLPSSPSDHPNMDTGTFTSAYDNLTCQKMVQ